MGLNINEGLDLLVHHVSKTLAFYTVIGQMH